MVLFIMCTLLSIMAAIAGSGRKPECQTLAFEVISVPRAVSSVQSCKELCNDKFYELQKSLWLPTQADIRDQIAAMASGEASLDRGHQFHIDNCVRQRRYCIGNSDIWLSISEPPAETSSKVQLSAEALRRVHAFTRTCSWERPDSASADQSCPVRSFRSCLCRRILVMMVVAQPIERQDRACSHQQICKRLTLRFSSTTFSQWICNRSFFIDKILCGWRVRSCTLCVGREAGKNRGGGPCFDATKLPADLQQGLELVNFALQDLPDTYTISFHETTKHYGDFRMRFRQFYPGLPYLPDKHYQFSGIPSLDDFLSTIGTPITEAHLGATAHTQVGQKHWISYEGEPPWASTSNAAHPPRPGVPDSGFETVSDWPPIPKGPLYQGSSSRNPFPVQENALISLDSTQAAINTGQTVDFLHRFESEFIPDILDSSTMELELAELQTIQDDEPDTMLSLDDSSFRHFQAENNPAASTDNKGKRKMDDRDEDDPTVDFFAIQHQHASLGLDLFALHGIDDNIPFENVAIHGNILQLHLSDTTSVRGDLQQRQRTLAQNIHVISSTAADDHSRAQSGACFASLSTAVGSDGTPRLPDQSASAEDTEKETLNFFQTIL